MYIENNIYDKGDDEHYTECLDYFDMDFVHLNYTLGNHPHYAKKINKPKNFEHMKDLSKELSKDFPFVRVDFYDVNGKVYISELTFIPTAGSMRLKPENVLNQWEGKNLLNIENEIKTSKIKNKK